MDVSLMRLQVKMPSISGGVVQRVKCVVWQDGQELGDNTQGGGGVGGESHSEQKAWTKAVKTVSRGGSIKFEVDGPICDGCTKWFETTMYDDAVGLGARLFVEVTYSDFKGQIEVTGKGTNWGLVSESGYYGQQQQKYKAEQEKSMAEKREQEAERERQERAKQKTAPVSKKKAQYAAFDKKMAEKGDDFWG
jgi:hypothetical protein